MFRQTGVKRFPKIQFTNHHVLVEVTGKGVSRGFGFELEMQVIYFSMDMQEL